MKLNNFFNKEVVTPRTKEREIININNEYREAKLQASIDELTQELVRLKVIENEYRDLRKTHQTIENKFGDSKVIVENLQQQQLRVNQDILFYESKLKEIPVLQEGLHKAEIDRDDFKQQFYKSDNKVQKQENELLTVKTERDELSLENKSLSIIAHKAETDIQSMSDDLSTVKNHAEEIDKKFNDISKIYIDAKRTNSLLKDESAYWQSLARTIQEDLEAKENLSTQLRSWIGKLETDQGKTNVKAQMGETKVNELQKVITDMGKSLDDILAERDYLNAINDQLKYKLSKAGYASVGAIAKKEGFKMSLANSATNWNKNYLGTARPTLLKFKPREEQHGNK